MSGTMSMICVLNTCKEKQQFFSAYDIAKYTKGTSKECNLHSQTIQAVAEELVTRRKQFKKSQAKMACQ
ncbi:hypothetical protein FSC17_11185 [Acinetobacter indicus]|nr:hypothetical protein FSC17_11185 [Acinetobacter indicus]